MSRMNHVTATVTGLESEDEGDGTQTWKIEVTRHPLNHIEREASPRDLPTDIADALRQWFGEGERIRAGIPPYVE